MEQLYKHIPCVYFSSTAEGLITEANEALCRYLNYTQNALLGQKLESIFTLSTRIFHQTHFYPLLQIKGHAEEIYLTLKSKSGNEVPMLMNAERIDENGEISFHFAGICVSKRKKFEDEIIAAKKSAEKALYENTALKAAQKELEQRAEELDRQIALSNIQNKELRQFNHLTTHTLQEPVRKLMFFSSKFLEAIKEEDFKASSLKIRKATEDINNKLHGLQQYLWLTNEKLIYEEVNLFNVMQAVKKMVELQNPGIFIMLEAEAIPVIEASIKHMQFLLKELLLNAVRFRKPGNIVNIKVYSSTMQLNIFQQLPGRYKYVSFVKLQIEDDGLGIDEKYQEQTFELFRILHPKGGLGMGLSLCKKIVENHGGSISLEGKKNVSTTVNIYLPIKLNDNLYNKQVAI